MGLDQVLHVLFEPDDHFLADVDVEIDLDRLVRRAHLHTSRKQHGSRNRRQEKAFFHRPLTRIPLLHRQSDRKSTRSELQSLMRISYAVFCLKKKKKTSTTTYDSNNHTHKHIQPNTKK